MYNFLDFLFPPRCPFCGSILGGALMRSERCYDRIERYFWNFPKYMSAENLEYENSQLNTAFFDIDITDRTENLLYSAICENCAVTLPWTAFGYDDKHKLRNGGFCFAPLRYEGIVREALLRMKFFGDSSVGAPLGKLMLRHIMHYLGNEKLDIITYVPISDERFRTRGYNQSELITKSVYNSLKAHFPQLIFTALIEKAVDNKAQSTLGEGTSRWENVSNVYRARENRHSAAGKSVLLIDDICTTGATLSECARVIMAKCGAERVFCATAAMTELRSHKRHEKISKIEKGK